MRAIHTSEQSRDCAIFVSVRAMEFRALSFLSWERFGRSSFLICGDLRDCRALILGIETDSKSSNLIRENPRKLGVLRIDDCSTLTDTEGDNSAFYAPY